MSLYVSEWWYANACKHTLQGRAGIALTAAKKCLASLSTLLYLIGNVNIDIHYE